jgi:AmiR/NasT family two-component response regulator
VEAVADSDQDEELTRMSAELEELARYADMQEQKASQLQAALDSRVVIEQAVGMLAERFDLSIGEAFELLRRAARESRSELRALAAQLTQSRRATPDAVTAARIVRVHRPLPATE